MTIRAEWTLGGPPERDLCLAGKELRMRWLQACPQINPQVYLSGNGGLLAEARRMVREMTHGDLQYRAKRLAWLSHVRECAQCRLAVGAAVSSRELRAILRTGVGAVSDDDDTC